LLPDPSSLGETLRRPERTTADAVVGSTDAHLTVDRVSSDVATLLDHRAADVVGQSLLRLVDTSDVAPLLKALARSSDTGLGTSLWCDRSCSASVPAAASCCCCRWSPHPASPSRCSTRNQPMV
jgi:hypothetical protein